jgi:hypothetical protein
MQDDLNISEISMDGYQVVRGEYFSRVIQPSCSLWYSSIAFNKATFDALNNCDSVSILVHGKARCIIVKPVPSRDQDAVSWLRNNENHKYQKTECSRFTHPIFDLWGWDKELHYRTNGRLVMADKKLMLLYDFSKAEQWRGLKMVREFE